MRILIVGGGFGGVRAALDLAAANLPGVKIVLVSDKPHFEYHAALYRVVTGRSPLEVCIPLRDIFAGKNVEIVQDTISDIDLAGRTLQGASSARYKYDYLILALGSETSYFDIPGLREWSFGFKSISEALKLKRHLHEMFEELGSSEAKEKTRAANFVIVGGGASGTELAGELAVYTAKLARKHKVDGSFVTIDLVEAAPRLLPLLPESVSERVTARLRQLGVNIFVNRTVVKEQLESLRMKDMELATKTVIWTAGVKPHHLYSNKNGFFLNQKGKVQVDNSLRASGQKRVFVIGDAAATKYSGMAQTAVRDGRYVARFIVSTLSNKVFAPHQDIAPYYSVPVGPGWAASLIGKTQIYGRLGWWFRRFADLRFFLSILPLRKAFLAFQNERTLCESCQICYPEALQ